MNDLRYVEDILEKLKVGATKKKIHSLEIINSICKDQIDRGSEDLTIAMIGRLSSASGGPSEQAIRNAAGKTYRILIDGWRKQVEPKKIIKRKISSEFAWIDDIDKPNIKWLAEDLHNRFIALRNELTLIKQVTEINIDMRPTNKANSSGENITLSDIEKRALEHSIAQETLDTNGWRVDERGQVLGTRNNQIFKPGFITALKKIIDSQ